MRPFVCLTSWLFHEAFNTQKTNRLANVDSQRRIYDAVGLPVNESLPTSRYC